jgi:hypothetical protein
MPRTWKTSLTEIGIPCSGPRRRFWRNSASRARASASALSVAISTNAVSSPLRSSILASASSTSRSLVVAPPSSAAAAAAIRPLRGSPPGAGSGAAGGVNTS